MTKELEIPLESSRIADEDNEKLIKWAVRNRQDKDSINNEETHRTKFRRERDRILYSGGFRRLQDKTQVMSAVKTGDHRTRLTHSLEVEQIAMSIANALRLNRDLVSAIALGHDVGHTPFGHAVERLLDRKLKDEGGFSHAIQSARYLHSKGIELSYEIVEGILKHDTDVFVLDNDDNRQFAKCLDYKLNKPGTLEAQVVYWSDKIAYITHDYEDFVKSNILGKAIKNGELKESDLRCILASLIDYNNGQDKIKILDILIDINNFKTRDLIRNILFNLINTSGENIKNLDNLENDSIRETLNEIEEKHLNVIKESVFKKLDEKNLNDIMEFLNRIKEKFDDNRGISLKKIKENLNDNTKQILESINENNLEDNLEIILNTINKSKLDCIREITLNNIKCKQKDGDLEQHLILYEELQKKEEIDQKIIFIKDTILGKLREHYIELEIELEKNLRHEKILIEEKTKEQKIEQILKEVEKDPDYIKLSKLRTTYQELKSGLNHNDQKENKRNKGVLKELSEKIMEKEREVINKFNEEIEMITSYLKYANRQYFIDLQLKDKEEQLKQLEKLEEKLDEMNKFKTDFKNNIRNKEKEIYNLEEYIEINEDIEEYREIKKQIKKLEEDILINKIKKIKKRSYQDGLLINLSDDYRLGYLRLREVVDKFYILSAEIQFSDAKAEKIVEYLYDMYTKKPGILPIGTRKKIEPNESNKNRVVADYISSMSDRYAEEIYMDLSSTAGHYEY
ncbi:HD domain-containing protein [Tissierella praeacuta]|uniref:HD domain-containing protein n=1 Tax=Tissierella praeacuta TaxID=43131 RepID=UPI0028B0B82A|nr:HD domain-containing protein [Tissierella praeacuta]